MALAPHAAPLPFLIFSFLPKMGTNHLQPSSFSRMGVVITYLSRCRLYKYITCMHACIISQHCLVQIIVCVFSPHSINHSIESFENIAGTTYTNCRVYSTSPSISYYYSLNMKDMTRLEAEQLVFLFLIVRSIWSNSGVSYYVHIIQTILNVT